MENPASFIDAHLLEEHSCQINFHTNPI